MNTWEFLAELFWAITVLSACIAWVYVAFLLAEKCGVW